MTSIRRNLLLSLLTGLLACTAVMGGIAYLDTAKEFHELFSDNLRRIAVVIEGQAFPRLASAIDIPAIHDEEPEESYVIQIWGKDGKLVRSSSPEIELPLEGAQGFSEHKSGSRVWQIYTLKAKDVGFIQVAEPKDIVATMVGESAARALAPLIALFLMLVVVAWILVGRGLTPFARLSRAIAGWNADKMEVLPVADTPQELQPVVSALNDLVVRLDKALSMQRQFMADAAHELRTPLTAIKLQLGNLARAKSDAERAATQKRLSEGIDRCIHLAGQLLSASRSTSVQSGHEFKPVMFGMLVRAALGVFDPLAAQKKIDLGFEGDEECFVEGDEESLRILVNNLIDNAVRYTPAGGTVTARLYRENGRIVFEARDTGPGIPETEREKIFRRFYRMPGMVSTGSGLGLSIVKSIADLHRAKISIADNPQGSGAVIAVSFADSGKSA
ncbi:MAG: hypothetical protein KGI97_00935 [Alphaproteobacteria bacterium]|nr:hypothetical protein [Alphaproteobacteria bacterium]